MTKKKKRNKGGNKMKYQQEFIVFQMTKKIGNKFINNE